MDTPKEEMSTVKLYTRTVETLMILKKRLQLSSIKAIVAELVDATTEGAHVATSRAELRLMQQEILDKCQQIQEMLSRPVEFRLEASQLRSVIKADLENNDDV